MGTRVPIYNDENNSNLRPVDTYIDERNLGAVKKVGENDRISGNDRDAVTEDSVDHDEGSNTVVSEVFCFCSDFFEKFLVFIVDFSWVINKC